MSDGVRASSGGAVTTWCKRCAPLLVVGCGSFEQRAEFWPFVDASPGVGVGGLDPTVAGTGAAGSATGSGGTAGARGTETLTGAGGDVGTGQAGGSTGSAGTSVVTGVGGAGGGVDAGRDSGGNAGSQVGGAGSCSLSVTVTTVTANGNYSPRNVGAIWIARDNGAFVKTLAVWARQRISRLTMWNSTTSQAGLSGNTVDAITGATLSNHQTHKVSWNCTDTSKQAVDDGAYRVYFEMTDRNGAGPNTFVSFTKGPMPFDLAPPDQNNFKGIGLVYTP